VLVVPEPALGAFAPPFGRSVRQEAIAACVLALVWPVDPV